MLNRVLQVQRLDVLWLFKQAALLVLFQGGLGNVLLLQRVGEPLMTAMMASILVVPRPHVLALVEEARVLLVLPAPPPASQWGACYP